MTLEVEKDLPPEPPVCADCAHLVGRRTVHENAKDWKCAAQHNVTNITKDLVTGFNVYHYKYETCYEARKDQVEILPSDFAHDFCVRGDMALKVDRSRRLPQLHLSCGPAGLWFLKYEHIPHNPRGLNLGKVPTKVVSAENLLDELENLK